MKHRSADPNRPADPGERYRLYIDESGDHVFKHLDHPSHRFLCLLGCFFQGREYVAFHDALEDFKRRHIPHSPDEPVVLHREDIINRRHCFWRLRNPRAAEAFDSDLVALIADASFRMVAVVIDKEALVERYPTPAHPYHLALDFMLQRYCGFLNHVNRRGDVMAESRGGKEDHLLRDSYARAFERGAWMVKAEVFQRALTSGKIKLRKKTSDIAGLQLADLLAHPIRQSILIEKGMIHGPLKPFPARLVNLVGDKFNKHLYQGKVWGYGKVLFPR